MTMRYEFSCTKLGCKAHVHVILHMHDDHECDIEQLGKALGFQRVGPVESFVRRWQCSAHDQEVAP